MTWLVVPFFHGKYEDIGGDFRGKFKDKGVMDGIHPCSEVPTFVLKFFNLLFEFHILLAHEAGIDANIAWSTEEAIHLELGRLTATAQKHRDT